MNFLKKEKKTLSDTIRSTGGVDSSQRLRMAVTLSVPAIIAQVSATAMEYIDASMVGSLGALPSASIGLVTTTTWFFMGLCSAFAMGFSVQVAHLLGSGNNDRARSVVRQAFTATIIYSVILAAAGVAISGPLPQWLGGTPDINGAATLYFRVFALSLPALQLSFLTGGMLRCSGDMFFPGMAGVLMCVLDVVFNFLLIFPTREISILGFAPVTMPGAGLGVWGAALGTALAEIAATLLMLWKLTFSSPQLRLRGHSGSFWPTKKCLSNAVRIGAPLGMERFLTSGAQIVLTVIVAPLGACAIAANAFAVTAEAMCYMPGYGISEAATTLVGQSIGAGRRDLARQFAKTCVAMGMIAMTLLGVVMWVAAPEIIGIMTPDAEIVRLGVNALRTEAWAEPMFAAAIVTYGVFVGAGDTLAPAFINLGCMWGIRIVLAAILAPAYGLHGVWVAMAVELSFRGAIFLLRLRTHSWMKKAKI